MKTTFSVLLILIVISLIGINTFAFADTPLMAVVDTGDSSVLAELRSEPSKDGKLLGTFYNGVDLEVIGQKGEWSTVVLPEGFRGYMKTEMLCIGDGRINVTYAIPIKEVANSSNHKFLEMQTLEGKSTAFLVSGTLVSVYGYSGNKAFIRLDEKFGFISNDALIETSLPTCRLSQLTSLGDVILDGSFETVYFNLYPSEEKPWVGVGPVGASGSGSECALQELELLADLGNYLQVRGNYHIFFVSRKFIKTINVNPPK